MIRKLRNNTNLGDDDIDRLRALPIYIRELPANKAIVLEGDRPGQCCLMIQGFSVRSKTTDVGKRQILSIHIPGDVPDLQSLHIHVMDHDFKTLTRCIVGFISHEPLRALTRSRPLIAEALWRETLIDAAIFREWIVNVGRRPATTRLAHLMLEVRHRLAVVGRAGDGRGFELPMTQSDIADAIGLTPVHVNRTLKALREAGLMELHRQVVMIKNEELLLQMADFDNRYLHQNPGL
jgi:CRP-like cAMP-binding protein